jgi:putative hemolysin
MIWVAVAIVVLVLAGCKKDTGMPNPASVYCEEQGGTLDIRESEAGSVGYCLFEDGSECEEWAFYNGECAPGSGNMGGSTGLANPASVYCQGLGYTEETRENADGQYGVCILPGGLECNSWDFLAGRCGPEYSYCATQGHTLEETPDANVGTCVFDNGTSCLEIDYFEGRCGPS